VAVSVALVEDPPAAVEGRDSRSAHRATATAAAAECIVLVVILWRGGRGEARGSRRSVCGVQPAGVVRACVVEAVCACAVRWRIWSLGFI
jgi:hypothetical protein